MERSGARHPYPPVREVTLHGGTAEARPGIEDDLNLGAIGARYDPSQDDGRVADPAGKANASRHSITPVVVIQRLCQMSEPSS